MGVGSGKSGDENFLSEDRFREEIKLVIRSQNTQSWWMTGLSILIGWLMGQVSLHVLLPHIFSSIWGVGV